MCGLGKMSYGAKFRRLKKNPDHQKILEELTYAKRQWEGNKKNPYVKIARGDLTEKAKFWFYFLSSVLTPIKHVCTMRLDKAILLYAILKGYMTSFGKIIKKSILDYQSNNFFGHIPHPSIITHLCIKGGVTFENKKKKNAIQSLFSPSFPSPRLQQTRAKKNGKKLRKKKETKRLN